MTPREGGLSPRSASLLTLRGLSTGYRVLFTGVLAFVVIGFAAGLVQQHLQAGLTPEGVADWHLGNAGDPDAAQLLFAADPGEALDRVWRRTLADVVPLVVLLALWFRASVSPPAKWGVAAGLVACAVVDVSAPALVRFGGRGFGAAAWSAQVGLAAVAAAVAARCLWEMWVQGGEGPRFRDRVEAGA